MFIPAYYRNENIPSILQFIRKNPFALVVNTVEGKPWATHLPLELFEYPDGRMVLQGHLSRANQQSKSFTKDGEVMVIFNGPHAYVSSSWYNHVNVPTWNYIAVHVYGKLRILEKDELLDHLKRIVDHFEQGMEKPVSTENLPAELMSDYLKGIKGFEISLDRIQGKWKLSQNRDKEDHANIVRELEKIQNGDARAVAEEMKKHSEQ